MTRPKIVMIGGGSKAWAPNIVKDLILTEPLRGAEIVLYDTDREAVDLVARVLTKLQGQLGTKATVTPTDNRAEAFKGANYFIITISTGGLDAMAHDIAIPEKYGIYHTVGDTSGPGGWARLLRNFGVFVDLGTAINRYAPDAMILNYTNPMTTLTKVLSEICEGPVVGLCHGLFENLDFIKKLYKIENEDLISAKYAGLNHFFWITELRAPGRDLLADLRRKLKTRGFTELRREAYTDAMGHHSNRELATELFRATGCLPYLGDRHTCEFFPGYITSQRNMAKYKLIRTPIAARRKNLRDATAALKTWAKAGAPDWLLKRSRETAADIIAAHTTGRAFIDVGNLPNIGQVSSLPPGTVVETAVRVDRNGFAPIAFGDLPEIVNGFVEPFARSFDLGVDACFACDLKLALRALRLDPVCSHLNNDEVQEMGKRLVQAHRQFMPGMARQLKG